MPESGNGDMSISSKTRRPSGSGTNPAALNEIWRYTIFELRALHSRHEAICLPRRGRAARDDRGSAFMNGIERMKGFVPP
jgi:hypothetical protein